MNGGFRDETVGEKDLLERLFGRIGYDLSSKGKDPSKAADSSNDEYDVFVSYAHDHDEEVKEFVKAMTQNAPHLRIFFDRTSIPAGAQWIKMISDAVQKAHKFIAVLSP